MDNKKCFVYCLYDKLDCKIRYIGVSLEPKKRFACHISESKNIKTKKLAKSKWINKCKELSYKIIFIGTESECYEKEKEIIKKYKKKYNLVNSTSGGDKPPKINELDKKLYKEIINKISESKKGQKLSEATRLKMSESHKLNPPFWLESKGAKNGRAYAVFQYDINGNFIKKWECAKYAINELKIHKTGITACLKGKQKTAGGYVWRTD